jgi:hypothetical protein
MPSPEHSGTSEEQLKVRRSASAIAEVEHLRHSEMQSISDRLGRIGDFPWASMWITAATLMGGAVVGGLFGLIPFLATKQENETELVYLVALGVGVVLTILCLAGAWTTHEERSESIASIKTDFDTHILGTFDRPGETS